MAAGGAAHGSRRLGGRRSRVPPALEDDIHMPTGDELWGISLPIGCTPRTAMNDLVVMECASDPAGFKATILDARSLRIKMAENSSAIKASLPPLQKALEETKQKIITRGNNS